MSDAGSHLDAIAEVYATGHWLTSRDHPIIRSYEPGESRWWCYEDELAFEIPGAPPAPSHP